MSFKDINQSSQAPGATTVCAARIHFTSVVPAGAGHVSVQPTRKIRDATA